MPFSRSDFRALLEALRANPEWRAELRQMLLTEELLELPGLMQQLIGTVRALAEAQQRFEQRLSALEQRMAELAESIRALTEAQRRFEQQQAELAQRQAALEERQSLLEQRMAELAESIRALTEAQQRSEQRQAAVERELRQIRRTLSELSQAFGVNIEDEAAELVVEVMRQKGYRVLEEPFSLTVDSEGEIDIVLPVEDAAGQRVWVVVEAKARLHPKNVLKWAQRVNSAAWRKSLAARGCPGPYLFYMFAVRLHQGVRQVAEEQGIGVLHGRGEVLAPRSLVDPASD
ncbi:MAG: YraN family protein [Thermoflexales bacterium]|nr:YraN family protein [Thermoflexales bacterium]